MLTGVATASWIVWDPGGKYPYMIRRRTTHSTVYVNFLSIEYGPFDFDRRQDLPALWVPIGT